MRFFFKINLFIYIYFWLCWVFVSVRGLSPVAASGGHSSSRCAGLSLLRPLLLRSTGSRRAGSVVVAHGLSCSAARGILPDQGSNPCPLHWQADSQPLRHQGSPGMRYLIFIGKYFFSSLGKVSFIPGFYIFSFPVYRELHFPLGDIVPEIKFHNVFLKFLSSIISFYYLHLH